MIRHVKWILWLLIALTCDAAEIVAWKVPLDRLVGSGMETKGIVRCKSTPESSPFFKPGDVLWNLKGISTQELAETEPPLEWMVWNETSERLVVKADWNGIWQVHLRLKMDQLQKQCRLKAEVFAVQADGPPLTEESVPLMVISGVSKSGQECDVSQQQGGKMIRLKGTATLSDSDPLVDLGINVSIALPDQPGLEFQSCLTLLSDKALWAARDFDGTKGMDLKISASIEMLDGTPVSQALMIQKGDTVVPVEVDRRQMQKHRLGDKGWLNIQWLDPQGLVNTFLPDPSAGPFAESDPNKVSKPNCFKEVMVPEILRPWFDTPVWDLREWTRNIGIDLKTSSDFAGYDPMTQRVFFFSNSEYLLDMFEQLYSPLCCLRPAMVVMTFEGDGQTRLVSRSGQLCRLKRTVANQKELRFLEIEPTVGEADDLVDMHLDYRDNSIDQRMHALKTAVILRTGKALELISGSTGDTKKSVVSVMAEVIQTR
jgi:hypothetical protein